MSLPASNLQRGSENLKLSVMEVGLILNFISIPSFLQFYSSSPTLLSLFFTAVEVCMVEFTESVSYLALILHDIFTCNQYHSILFCFIDLKEDFDAVDLQIVCVFLFFSFF